MAQSLLTALELLQDVDLENLVLSYDVNGLLLMLHMKQNDKIEHFFNMIFLSNTTKTMLSFLKYKIHPKRHINCILYPILANVTKLNSYHHMQAKHIRLGKVRPLPSECCSVE